MLVGFDKNHSEKTVIGAYVGGLKVKDAANGIVSDTNQSIDSSGAVIGGYSSTKLAHDAFVDVNLPVGYTQNKSKRTVYNNLVAGGIEYDNGKYNEFCFRPTATLGKNIDLAHVTVIPSATVSYLGQYLGGYTETGGTSAYKVGSRYVSTIGGIAQVAFLKSFAKNAEQPVNLAFNVGVEASGKVGGNDVKVTTIGAETKFNPGGPNQYIDAIAGLSVNRGLMKKGMNIFANLQGSKGITNSSGHNYKIALDAGVEVKF